MLSKFPVKGHMRLLVSTTLALAGCSSHISSIQPVQGAGPTEIKNVLLAPGPMARRGTRSLRISVQMAIT
jgi:uncharacterized protein YceK